MNTTNKLLVVDDCPVSRLIVKDMLTDSGLTIVETDSGADVMAVVINEKPLMILLDLHMPGKDGFDVLDELLEEHFHIPIVIISSDVTSRTKKTCLDMGVRAFLEKPLSADLLRETVRKYLQ